MLSASLSIESSIGRVSSYVYLPLYVFVIHYLYWSSNVLLMVKVDAHSNLGNLLKAQGLVQEVGNFL